MTEQLKPVRCGCGGEAKVEIVKGYDPFKVKPITIWHRVICNKCHTSTDAFPTEAEAITVWNKAMGADKIDELMEHVWRDKLDTREKIAELVERMLR